MLNILSMKLKDYVERNRVVISDMAQSLKIARQYLHEIINGRPCGRKLAAKIEQATKGQVNRLDLLYPD